MATTSKTASKTTSKTAAKKTATSKTAAKKTAAKKTTTRKVAVAMTEDGHPIYDAAAGRDAYKKGDQVYFAKVRNWLDKGQLVEAYGTVVNVALFDNEVPYLEVKFDDKKLNKVDLGKDVRKFLLEQK